VSARAIGQQKSSWLYHLSTGFFLDKPSYAYPALPPIGHACSRLQLFQSVGRRVILYP
jgi:hypothetical protein